MNSPARLVPVERFDFIREREKLQHVIDTIRTLNVVGALPEMVKLIAVTGDLSALATQLGLVGQHCELKEASTTTIPYG